MPRAETAPLFDRILGWSLDHPPGPVARYGIATALVVAIAVIRATLITQLVPWLLFVPAIITIALALGEIAGLYATMLAALLAGLTIGSAAAPWFLNAAQWTGSTLFVLIGIGLVRLAGAVRSSFARIRSLNAELAERSAFMASTLGSSTDCITVLDLAGRLSFMSEGGMKVMEIADFAFVKGRPWTDLWQGDGHDDATAAIERARHGETSHFIAAADTLRGTPRWWDVSVSPIPGIDGGPARILAVSRDTTALVEARDKQDLLNGELGHRLKNVLTLVQSIANQTFRQAESLAEANAAFASRIAALGKATDILTATAWQTATLADVIAAGLTSVDGMADRIRLTGPPIRLDAQIALALTLSLHELTTNACKYGALSNDCGIVALAWNYEMVENGPDGRFSLQWQESDGPAVSPPARTGFGSKMVERLLRSYLRGETAISYDPAGVIFTIDALLPQSAVSLGEQA